MIEATSYIELDRVALRNNLQFIRNLCGPDALMSSVVKGNAYGHGLKEFVTMACDEGLRHFSVFSTDEAFELHKHCVPESEIMIMGHCEGDALEWAVEHGYSFFVFDHSRLDQAIVAARKLGKSARIHVELETGMNRTGFPTGRPLDDVIKKLEGHSANLSVEGLCTHYAGAESIANYLRIQRQIKRYESARKRFVLSKIYPKSCHTACSAATVIYPKTRMDMVRIGIMQYGLWPSPETMIQYVARKKDKTDPLEPIISWKSRVMSVKQVKEGEYIGYGISFLARQHMRIATIPVGYAHGYARNLSNQGRLLIRGQRVGVVGMVNMNMLLADISDIEGVEKGDEVVLIGEQGERSVSISSFGQFSDQLNYELLTRLPPQIPRKIV